MKQSLPRIAFLMQCHKNPKQVSLLINSLNKLYNCCFFLHIDKKSAEIRDQICTENVSLLPIDSAVDVQWGKFSQCEATFQLIQAALSSGQEFDYLWLISGQDIPICSAESANRILSDCSVPYIHVEGAGTPLYKALAKRNDIPYLDLMLERTTKARIIRSLWKMLSGGKQYTFPLFRRKLDIPYYFGSSWWCLPCNCVKEMIELYCSSTKYKKYFSRSANPDESLFQTLFMQTSYAGSQQGILVYTDWSSCSASPKTFTNADFSSIKENGTRYMLARKFDFSVDSQVIYRVLDELCGLPVEL